MKKKSTMDEADMLPCPFCGNRPMLWPMGDGQVTPYCGGCGASFSGGALPDAVDLAGEFASDAKTAVKYWNRRAKA